VRDHTFKIFLQFFNFVTFYDRKAVSLQAQIPQHWMYQQSAAEL